MALSWIRGCAIWLGLCLGGSAVHAATITDATFEIAGDYAWSDWRYGLDGSFAGSLFGDPLVARDYDLGIAVAFAGRTVLDETLDLGGFAGGPFSIAEALGGAFAAPGLGGILAGLAGVTDDAASGPGSVGGDFAFRLDRGTSFLVRLASCLSLFGTGASCHAGSFSIALDLSYEAPDPAAVPLPAGLPLLGAGLAALALLRGRRG